MNDNEAANASASSKRSRRFKVTYERVAIECEDTWVFDGNHANKPDDRGGFEGGTHVDADLIAPTSDVDEYNGGRKGSAEYWPLPGTDCRAKACASPEGLRELEPSDTSAYAVARALQILRMLLQRMQRNKSEPVTLKAVDIPSAA